MTFMFFLSSPGECAGFPVSCSGCFLLQGQKTKWNFCSMWWMLPLPNRSLKKAICIGTTDKMVFLTGGLLSALLEIWFLESFNCESSTTSQSLEEFFRVALPVMLSSLNSLAYDLPGSLGYNDEILFWDLYPILCFKKNCHILFKGGRVKYPENGGLKKRKKGKSICGQVGQNWCLLLIIILNYT